MRCNKNKFNAQPQWRDGEKIASKLEAKYLDHLNILQKAGEIKYFLRQVPFHLPGGVIYRVDFMEVWMADQEPKYVEVKGFETPEWKLKKKMVEAIYPVEIIVVKRGDF